MIGLLVSLLGGPEGAVLMLLRRLGQRAAGVWAWATSSLAHALTVALALSLAGNAWQRHHLAAVQARAAHEVATWSHAFALERQAYAAQSRNVATLLTAIRRQNAAVAALGAEGQRRMDATHAAIVAAAADQRRREAVAQRIEAAAHAEGDCRTPAEVMEARGEL